MSVGDSLIPVGRIAGPYGIKGWVKVASFTDPEDNVFSYAPWVLRDIGGKRPTQTVGVLENKAHGKGWVAKLDGVQDRNAAETLKGLEIAVERGCLPDPDEGQYYWTDLEGLQVVNRDGTVLGRIDHMLETGSADVMVIAGERAGERCLVPFIMHETVVAVDLDAGSVRIDWDETEE